MKKFLISLSLLAGMIGVPQALFAQTSFQGVPLKTVPGLFNLPIPSVGTLKTPLPLACADADADSAGSEIRCPKFVISVDANGQTAEVDPQSVIDYVRDHPKVISGEVVDLPVDPDGVAGEPAVEQPHAIATGDQDPPAAASGNDLGNPHPEVAISGMGGCNLQIGWFGDASQAAWFVFLLAPLARFLKRK